MTPSERHELESLKLQVASLQAQLGRLSQQVAYANKSMLIMFLATRTGDDEAYDKYMKLYEETSDEIFNNGTKLVQDASSFVEETS